MFDLINDTCRFCASRIHKEKKITVDEFNNSYKNILQSINLLLSPLVVDESKLPKYICSNCSYEVECWNNFICRCQSTRNMFNNLSDIFATKPSIPADRECNSVTNEETIMELENGENEVFKTQRARRSTNNFSANTRYNANLETSDDTDTDTDTHLDPDYEPQSAFSESEDNNSDSLRNTGEFSDGKKKRSSHRKTINSSFTPADVPVQKDSHTVSEVLIIDSDSEDNEEQ